MRGGRSTDEQIIGVLREAGTGASTGDLCRRHGISHPRPSTTGGRDLAAFRNLRAMISDGNRPDPTDLKLQRIKEIRASGLTTMHVIHRHQIESQDVAYQIEAALIDAYPVLTNKVAGHQSGDYGKG